METQSQQSLYHHVLWGVRRSIRYHTRRRLFFERFNLVTNAVGVLFGSATILAVLNRISDGSQSVWWTVSPAAIVTIFSSLDLIIGTSRMAHLHQDLARRFIELEKQLVQMESPSEKFVREIVAQRLQIEADEPPIHRIVDILCHNELMKAEGYDPNSYSDHYYKVGWMQRFFAPFFDIQADNIRPMPACKPASS